MRAGTHRLRGAEFRAYFACCQRKYARVQVKPVENDVENLTGLGVKVVTADLVSDMSRGRRRFATIRRRWPGGNRSREPLARSPDPQRSALRAGLQSKPAK